MEVRKITFSACIFLLFISAISICQPKLEYEVMIEDSPKEKKTSGVIQMKNPALAGLDKLHVTVIPDKFCYSKGIEAAAIEESVKDIFGKAGIAILPAKDAEEAEFIIRIAGNDFEEVICATHAQSSLARKVYLRNPRAILKSEVWRVDVPIRFSSPDASKDAIIAEVTKQAEAFAEQWKLSNTDTVKPASNPGKTDSTTSATGKYKQKAQSQDAVKYLYVASKNSKVFHRADCRSAQHISDRNLVGFDSREQAIGSGRRPCKTCNP